MPYTDPEKRRARQKLYRQTPQGRAASQRAADRFYAKRRYAKRRGEVDEAPLIVDARALNNALSAWRTPAPGEAKGDGRG